jgi:hypothetical protein
MGATVVGFDLMYRRSANSRLQGVAVQLAVQRRLPRGLGATRACGRPPFFFPSAFLNRKYFFSGADRPTLHTLDRRRCQRPPTILRRLQIWQCRPPLPCRGRAAGPQSENTLSDFSRRLTAATCGGLRAKTASFFFARPLSPAPSSRWLQPLADTKTQSRANRWIHADW